MRIWFSGMLALMLSVAAMAADINGKWKAEFTGDDISFTAERPFGAFTYAGKISGNEIKFKVTFNDQSFEMTAKRLP